MRGLKGERINTEDEMRNTTNKKVTRHAYTGKKEIAMAHILILILFVATQSAHAQEPKVRVKLVQPPPNRLAVKDLWNLTVTNASKSEIKITLEGTVDEAKDGRIVEGATGVFTLKANEAKRLTADNIPGGGTYTWNNNKYKEAILRTGSAPSGSYTICIYAKSETGQQLAMDCIQHNIEMMSPPTLVSPADGETIPEGQSPTFTWLPPMPAPREAKYTLKIVEVIGNQAPEEAMKRNPALFEKGDIRTTTLQYPTSARKLEKGKKYVWRVTAGTTESEVWTYKTATNYIATIDSVDIRCSDSGAICFDFQVFVTNNNAPNAADQIGNNGEVYDLQVPGSSSVLISSPLGFPSSPHVLSYNASVTIMGKVCFSSFPSVPLKFRVSIRDQGNPNDHDAFTTKFVNTLPNCACDPCTDKTTTFGNPNDSTAITYQNDGSLNTSSTVTHTPRHLLRVSAQIVDFQRLGEAGCLLCTNDSKQFGNYTGGSLNGSAGTIVKDEKGYGKLIEWEFPTPTLVSNFSYDLQMMFPPLAAVSCCKDSIRICTRWSFTDDKCITCDTLICSTIIKEYKPPSKGPIFSSGAARKQMDERIAKMGEPYVSWYKQESDELPRDFTSQVQALYRSNEDKHATDRIVEFEIRVKATFFAIREMKKTATSSLWNAIQSNMQVSDMCGNGSFPNGVLDVAQWSGGYGIIYSSNDPTTGTYVSGFVPAANTGINQPIAAGTNCGVSGPGNLNDQATQIHHTLVGPGDDPTLGNLLQTTSASTNPFSFRIGNSCVEKGSEYLAKTFVVGGSGIIRFMYALVMDGIHSLTANPSFHVKVFDANGILLPGRVFLDPMSPNTATDIIVSSSTDPFFQHSGTGSNKINYRDWSCATIDLSGDIGQQVTVVMITTDCAHGAHYGYAYVDDWCGNCEGATTGNVTITAIQDSCISKSTQVCVNYTLPTIGTTTGSGTITLNFYQNGVQQGYSLTSPNLTASGSHCFAIDPNMLPCNQGLGGYDIVATGNFTIQSTPIVVTSPSPIGNPVQGIKPGINNDLLCCNNPVDDCCTHFVKEVTTQISMPNTSSILFTPTFKAGPKPIKQVRISAVNFETASSNKDCLVCESSAGSYGRMSVRMIPKNPIEGMNYPISIITLCLTCPPEWSTLPSHEVTWGNESGQGYDLMDGIGDQSTQFQISLPRQSTIPCCDDTIRICLKYSFMDVDCVTCDTIICFEIVNRQVPSPWSKLKEQGILHGDDDPVNRAINSGRQKMGKTAYGASIERWYADMNKQDWISVVIRTRRSDVMSLLAVGRKLIEENGVLERKDIEIVEKALRILDQEILPAPAGIIEESLKRLRSSIGMKWNQVLENVTR